jgi:hypothetical protein
MNVLIDCSHILLNNFHRRQFVHNLHKLIPHLISFLPFEEDFCHKGMQGTHKANNTLSLIGPSPRPSPTGRGSAFADKTALEQSDKLGNGD